MSIDSKHKNNNIPESIKRLVGKNLHKRMDHPLGQLKSKIEKYFTSGETRFDVFDSLSPIVTVAANFDDLLTPPDHVSRKPSDTYYIDDKHLLRCHMTAHQTELLRNGYNIFIMVGDVYRRDEVDCSHYPVFHQVDGVRIWNLSQLGEMNSDEQIKFVQADLHKTLMGLITTLFGQVEMRFIDAYFPFTHPSSEVEIFFGGKWLEVLGCGIIRQEILNSCEKKDTIGWAFGMGLERLAMVLHDIYDIRLFWSNDVRFLSQFADLTNNVVKFKPYSKYAVCYKDITFWIPQGYNDNDLYELIRELAGNIVESIELLDTFTHPKTCKISKCYRISYRHMDRTLTNQEIDILQDNIRKHVVDSLGCELR